MGLNLLLISLGVAGVVFLVWYFRSGRRILVLPGTVHLGIGQSASVTFTLQRKPARSATWGTPSDRSVALANAANLYSFPPPKSRNSTGGLVTVRLTGVAAGTSTLTASAGSGQPGRSYGPKSVDVIVHPGYDHAGHPHTDWEWVVSGTTGYYRLKGSNNKGYQCSEYTYSKLNWDSQNERPPYWCATGVCAQFVSTDVFEERMAAKGYVPSDPQGNPYSGTACGCGSGQTRNCAVIYFDTNSGAVFHVAAFDPVLCDWGGRLRNNAYINRFKNPQDYINITVDPSLRATTGMRFICKTGAAPDYISDEDLHAKARECR